MPIATPRNATCRAKAPRRCEDPAHERQGKLHQGKTRIVAVANLDRPPGGHRLADIPARRKAVAEEAASASDTLVLISKTS
ncbi:hypothetical protein BWR17_08550 [Phaeobacter inhibens]|nr:hypothetical protein BWR17_08550 [Phaeobacter inhibens]